MTILKKLLLTLAIAFAVALVTNEQAFANCGSCGADKKAEGSHKHDHDHEHHEDHKAPACANCAHKKICKANEGSMKKCDHPDHNADCVCPKKKDESKEQD